MTVLSMQLPPFPECDGDVEREDDEHDGLHGPLVERHGHVVAEEGHEAVLAVVHGVVGVLRVDAARAEDLKRIGGGNMSGIFIPHEIKANSKSWIFR